MAVDIDEEASLSWKHFIAGALAGTAEHTGMYPVDTIKTHVQAGIGGTRLGILDTAKNVFSKGGVKGLFNGLTAIAMGAAPAHAIYFASWEYFKKQFGIPTGGADLYPIRSGAAGVLATILNDAVLVPMDTVKQKRQLNIKNYTGTFDCIRKVIVTEGMSSLYAGYMTTLVMNIPYNFFYFPAYEMFRSMLKADAGEHDVFAHIIAGGGAGAFAAALTNPLDVAKTRLQTQHDLGIRYNGLLDALKRLHVEEGFAGFTRGMVPRMVFHSMSAGILWSTYEYVKYILGADHYSEEYKLKQAISRDSRENDK